MNVKGKGQRLIPEELLRYLEAYKEAHPDPEAGGGATLDDIVDSQGNKRFIEGEGTPKTVAGINSTYYKWTLSGTHLMIVYAFEIASGTAIDHKNLASFTVPSFILNNINVEVGTILYNINAICWRESAEDIIFKCSIVKRATSLDVFFNDSLTFDSSGTRYCRVQFDLIIATE